MSKVSRAIVLAEDARHQQFVYRFRRRLGLEAVRSEPLSRYVSGEQRVRAQYSRCVKALRSRHAASVLVVAIDADTNSVDFRARQLAQALAEDHMEARDRREAICLIIPKRNMETWILCLHGSVVDEEIDYKNKSFDEDLIPPAALTLFAWTRPNATIPSNCVPSIHAAIPELRRLDAAR